MNPPINYPPELPIVQARERILAALANARVLIVCGDTGSGKTTQLPKMAMEAGFGAKGRRIACTQPRRIAAMSVAERVAAELGEPLGQTIGYQHRFGRAISAATRVKFMTDGILLAEYRADPLLRAYDLIIIDEAHERSLNIDFLLGILKRLLTRRADLKVIISSATLDTAGFARFFDDAPTIIVSGRLHPVEIRYAPPDEDSAADLPRMIRDAVATLPPDFDTLVFLPGERDIREAAEILAGAGGNDDIIPLMASLPASEQQRAFRSSPRRRVILATNVAETSLTIPGIRAVIDSGLARISRYLHRTQVQRLQIEPVSQASARQRAGRCGRVGPGVCIRLYSEEDFLSREEFTPPEILRSSLAGVILTMLELRLGDISRFPFIDPPRSTMITAGLRELLELGAIRRGDDGTVALTPIGRRLARFPIEPRLARMLLSASELATLPRALPIVAAMAGEDPRRRPVDEIEKARQAHAQFKAENSDFLGTLKLWRWWTDQAAALSQSRLRKLCKTNYLAFTKMREWDDTVRQLTALAKELKLDLVNDAGDDAALHRSLLSGLLSRIGHFDTEARDYRGVHGLRFAPHPSSALKKQTCEWIVAGELVDTSRLFARNAAAIDAAMIERAAAGLLKSHYHSPEWDGQSGFVRATEQVTLYGLVIVPARRCDYTRIDPVLSREIFLRRGIVDGDFPKAPPVLRHNRAVLDELRREAEKFRDSARFDEDVLYCHFDRVIPAEIASAPALLKWLRAVPEAEKRLRLERRDWFKRESASDGRFPDSFTIGKAKLKLVYRHTPDDSQRDGVTCCVRRRDAAALRLWRHEWLVPGMLPEKLAWMLSVLPKSERRLFAPLDDYVAGLMSKLKPGAEPLFEAVVNCVRQEWGFRISADAWARSRMPEHLRMRFVVRDDETGRPIAAGRELEAVLQAAGVSERTVGYDAADERVHVRWDFGDLPEKCANAGGGGKGGAVGGGWALEHFPALHDEGTGVTVRLHADADEAAREHAAGVTRLYLLAIGDRVRSGIKARQLPQDAAVFLKSVNYELERLRADILFAAIRAALVDALPPIRTADAFEARLTERLAELISTHTEIERLVIEALAGAGAIQRLIETDARIPSAAALAVQTQLVWLMPPGFAAKTPLKFLRHFKRYLNGARTRLDRARVSPTSDAAREMRFDGYWQRYRKALAAKSPARPAPETLTRYRWMLEEFRISIFAQELKTAYPVSEKRLDAILQ